MTTSSRLLSPFHSPTHSLGLSMSPPSHPLYPSQHHRQRPPRCPARGPAGCLPLAIHTLKTGHPACFYSARQRPQPSRPFPSTSFTSPAYPNPRAGVVEMVGGRGQTANREGALWVVFVSADALDVGLKRPFSSLRIYISCLFASDTSPPPTLRHVFSFRYPQPLRS